ELRASRQTAVSRPNGRILNELEDPTRPASSAPSGEAGANPFRHPADAEPNPEGTPRPRPARPARCAASPTTAGGGGSGRGRATGPRADWAAGGTTAPTTSPPGTAATA